MYFKSMLFCLFLIFFTGCTQPYVSTKIKQENLKSLRDTVSVYGLNDEVPLNYKEVGEIFVGDSGMTVDCKYNTMLGKILEEAKKINVDAIKLTEVLSPNFVSTCTRITAKVYIDEYNGMPDEDYLNNLTNKITAIKSSLNSEYYNKLLHKDEIKEIFIQPKNKQEACKILKEYTGNLPTDDKSYNIFWDGTCSDGYAQGLGRIIERSDSIDNWKICKLMNGKTNDYFIYFDYFNNKLTTGKVEKNAVIGTDRIIKNYKNDITVEYWTGKSDFNSGIFVGSITSPFKDYTNYQKKFLETYFTNYTVYHSNNTAGLFLMTKYYDNLQTGLGFIKKQNSDTRVHIIQNGKIESVPNKFNSVILNDAEKILLEARMEEDKAKDAENKANLLKRRYLENICSDKVTVDFIPNNAYKSICDDKFEHELITKIEEKKYRLEREDFTKKKALLEEQRIEREEEMLRLQTEHNRQLHNINTNLILNNLNK